MRVVFPERVEQLVGNDGASFRKRPETCVQTVPPWGTLPSRSPRQRRRHEVAARRKRAYTPIYVHVRPMSHSASPAVPSPACACGRLRRATRALTQLYDDAMMPAGLRVTQFSLLRTLARNGALRISDLAARQLLDRTALSRNLDPLVEHGFVEVLTGHDARTREVALTREGSAALKRAEPHWARAQKIVAQRLGADRLDALIATLGELETLHPGSRPSPQPSPRAAGRGGVEPSPRPTVLRAGRRSDARPSKRS